jgi:phosphoenolpyruvate---glycerone phosphotransferase subunit DhaL
LRILERPVSTSAPGGATLGRAALLAAIGRLEAAMDREFDRLNAADGALGDGDLGVTMRRGMTLVAEAAPDLPDDLGQALMRCAQAFTRSSGSSYGTLLATGLIAMAKALRGRSDVQVSELSGLVAAARDAMIARGKAELGGKTVLDSLEAVAQALGGVADPTAAADAAPRAARAALETFRDRPATVGRARIFAEKSRGLDDPGMLAMALIVEAIAARPVTGVHA